MKKRLNLTVDPEVKKDLKDISKKNNRSLSSMINVILIEGIERIKKKLAKNNDNN